MDSCEARKQLYKKVAEASEKYGDAKLDLKIRIKSVLEECGIDTDVVNNVYIGEDVHLPDAFGCYLSEGKIVAYFTNDKAIKITLEYEDFPAFMWMFVQEAPKSSLYQNYSY